MKKGLTTLMIITLFLTYSCGNNSDKNTEVDIHKGQQLFNQNCQSCHNQDTPVGPPVYGIKMHYLEEHPEKEEFTNAINAFVLNPSEDKALLKHAVEKFGLMPRLSYSTENLNAIAEYIYETDFPKPGKQKGKRAKEGQLPSDPLELGMHYAKTTKAELGKNLMQALNKQGAAGALEFCNTRSIPITDSMSAYHGVKIRRVSDQPRNPENAASEEETEIIKTYKHQLAAGNPLKPELIEEGNVFRFYAPITTNQMCLQCHGTPESEINQKTIEKLAKLYPEDQATGYAENQVRGMWRIEFTSTAPVD